MTSFLDVIGPFFLRGLSSFGYEYTWNNGILTSVQTHFDWALLNSL